MSKNFYSYYNNFFFWKNYTRLRWKNFFYLHRASGPDSRRHLWQVRRSRSNQGQIPRCWHRMSQHAARTVCATIDADRSNTSIEQSNSLLRTLAQHHPPPRRTRHIILFTPHLRRIASRSCLSILYSYRHRSRRVLTVISRISATPEIMSAIAFPLYCTCTIVHGS